MYDAEQLECMELPFIESIVHQVVYGIKYCDLSLRTDITLTSGSSEV